MKLEKESGFAIGLKLLLAMPDNSLVTAEMLHKGHKRDMTAASAYNVLWKLSKHNGMKKDPVKKGVFRTIKAGLIQYASDHATQMRHAPLRSRGKGGPERKLGRHTGATRTSQSKAPKDMDIIEELLDVMARAEPVLKRLRDQDAKLRALLD